MEHPRIQSDPKIMMGKPVIRGTRITVEHILRCLAAGDSIEQLLSDYPRLTVEDVRAAQAFAADHLASELRIRGRVMARLFADECVAGSTVAQLRSDGLDVVWAADVCPTADDEQVLAEAYRDGRVLITADKDFGELVFRQSRPAIGVVNLALGDLAAATRARIVSTRLSELGDRIVGAFGHLEK